MVTNGKNKDINLSESKSKRLAEYIKSVEIFKQLPSDIKIQLIDIRENEKTPRGGMSWKDRTFSFEYGRELIEKYNFNIAIVAHIGGVCFMDIDLTDGKFTIPKTVVDELIETYDTFTVRTKSGGIQLYFINDELTKHFVDNGYAANPKLMFNGKDAGEIRTNWQYVLFPGSFVPIDYDKKGCTVDADGMYTVIRNSPLRKLSSTNLPQWFVIEQDKRKTYKRNKAKSTLDVNKITPIGMDEKVINDVGLTLEEVRAKDPELNELLMGADHIGDRKSRSEADFRTCVRLDYWRFDDNQRASILQKFRVYEKVMRLDYLLQTVDKARSNEKYNPDYTKILEKNLTKISKVEESALPKTLTYDYLWELIRAPPRLGKTHRSMEWMVQAGSGVYCTNRHEIINHAMNIFAKYIQPGKTAVYLAGKDRCCNREGGMDCEHCPKAPHTFVPPGDDTLSLTKAMAMSLDLLEKHKILTPDLLMAEKSICPYFTLMLAETVADYCFTIPFFLMNKDHIRGVKKQRPLLIIDEDPVCSAFYPQGWEVVTHSYIGKRAQMCTNEIASKVPVCESIEKMIKEKKRLPWVDKEIMRMISIIYKINELVEGFIHNPGSEQSEDLIESINAIDISNNYTRAQKDEIRKKIVDYERELKGGHDTNIYDIFAPLVHIAKLPFVWMGNHPRTMHFVANREVMWVPEDSYKKRIIIGATESEMYIQDACGSDYEKMSRIIEINSFKYSKNFVLIRLKSDKKKTETKMFYKLLNMLAKDNAENDKLGQPVVPHLVLESSKSKQESLQKHLKSRCIISTNDSEIDQYFNWETGKANIFYSNSTLSRGLDIPFYDLIFADSLNFSVPYWSAMKEYWKRSGNTNKVFECNTIITKVISDEVTNSVLRCSPTQDFEYDPVGAPGVMTTKEKDSKVIVIRDSDVSKILPSVRTGMRDMEVVVSTEESNANLESKLQAQKVSVTKIPKKVSRVANLENKRNTKDHALCIYLLRSFLKNNSSKSTLDGVSVDNLDEFLKSVSATELFLSARILVDPAIRDLILKDSALNNKKSRSEQSLVNMLMTRASKQLKLTKQRIKKTVINMVQSGMLRSTFKHETGTRYYSLPDKTLYGDPSNAVGGV